MPGDNIQSEWASQFPSHPIFKTGEAQQNDGRLTVDDFSTNHASHPRRTSRMCFRGSDIVLAVGKELRLAPFVDYKGSLGGSTGEGQYKSLHTPNIQFDIEQISLCSGGKMIAVAGAHQVAVVVLPRPSYYKLVNTRVDAKSIQIGQFYHAVSGSSRIAKIDWHPWHDGGSSLLVLTADGVLREYDVGRDAEEPQQTLSFVPDRVVGRFSVEDPASHEAVSFCIGKGVADWSPLTVFTLMKNGDVWGMSPFLPATASVPASYIPALECFVAAKRELIEARASAFMSASTSSLDASASAFRSTADSLAVINDHQTKFVNALTRQLAVSQSRGNRQSSFDAADPFGSPVPSSKTPTYVTIRLPTTQRHLLARQGPFLFQPSPPELESSLKYGSEFENEATDIMYVGPGESTGDDLVADLASLSIEEKETADTSESLGIIAIVWKDGKVDLCLDAEKVEAKWDFASTSLGKQVTNPQDLPSLTVFESIDLGILNLLEVGGSILPPSFPKSSEAQSKTISLIRTNYPTFHLDPLCPGRGRLFVSHSFGVHLVDMSGWIRTISKAIMADDELEHDAERDDKLVEAVSKAPGSQVSHLLSSFSTEQKSTTPIISVAILDNSTVDYSLIALTAQHQAVPIPLVLKSMEGESRDVLLPPSTPTKSVPKTSSTSPSVEQAYISLLTEQPFIVPNFPSRQVTVSIAAPRSLTSMAQPITPETLRVLGKRVEGFRSEMRDLIRATGLLQDRIALQEKEMGRQLNKLVDLVGLINALKSPESSSSFGASNTSEERLENIVSTQKSLLTRLDRVLQRLMDSYSPKLSEFESKWFAELGRMDREVNGVKGLDGEDAEGRSLKSRADLLSHQISLLKPLVEELNQKEEVRRKRLSARKSNGAPVGLGSAQLRSFQRRLAQESSILEAARSQAEHLTRRLQMSESI